MEITAALAGARFVSDALGRLIKKNQPTATNPSSRCPAGGKPPGKSSLQAVAGIRDPAVLWEIVAQYDVTDITARKFSEMIRRLAQAGALTEQQFQELSLIRLDLDLDGIDPDESLDLLDFYADKLSKLEGALEDLQDGGGPSSTAKPVSVLAIDRRLAWLQKFALIQSGPDAIGMDALA